MVQAQKVSVSCRMYVCIYVFMYVCVYICMYVCVYICMYVCVVYLTSVSVTRSICPIASSVLLIMNDKSAEGSGRGLIQGGEKTRDVVSVPAEMLTGYIPNTSQDSPLQAT
jgi:hypothetical protein